MKRKIVAVFAAVALCAGGGVADAAVGPAGINGPGLAAVGPISATDGFPTWYKDKLGLRLEHCLDVADPMCPSIADLPNPLAPVSFPDNYPEEAFYARVEAKIAVPGPRVDALVEIQLEQAFGAGAPSVGDQITFARVRYRFDANPGVNYKVTSPATGPDGKIVTASAARGEVFDTEDLGLGGGDFSGALGGRVGPFLTWDDYASVPADPRLKPNALGKPTYIGDGLTPHKITGSAYNTNFFRIEGPGINPTPTVDACPTVDVPFGDCVETDLFAVQGKLATTAGVTAEKATYSRSAATDGFVDVFATTEPDAPQAIQVTDVSAAPAVPEFATTALKGSLSSVGHYYAHIPYTGAEPPATLQVSNISDVPVSNQSIDVVDQVSGTAIYTPGAAGADGSLVVKAVSSDTAVARVLTASGFAALPVNLALGTLTVPALDAPPVSVTVTSDAGGSVKLPVVVMGEVAVANAGPNQTVIAGQLVTLDGSATTGALTYAWTGPTGIVLSDAAVSQPTFTAPAVPGVYPFTLTATGPGGSSTATVTITVIERVPDAPVIGTATAGNTTATVTWTAPAPGGSAVTGYLVRVVDAAGLQVGALRPAAADATTLDVTGLANAPVTFQILATSLAGPSAFSALSNVVTPVAVPSAPVIVTATAGDTTATVTWTAPVDGGSPITGYTVRVIDAADAEVALLPAAADATSLTVPGLVNGTAVRFQVQATSAIGTGAFSALSSAVTPAVVPDAPVIGTATVVDGTTTVTWTAPVNNGGSAVTGYSVRVADAATDVQIGALVPAAADATSLVLPGLVNGTAVTFQVQATNAAGAGAFSALSNAVTPTGAPDAPVIGTATVVNDTATVTWTAPANNGGSAVTGYSVRVVDAADLQVGALLPVAADLTSLDVTGLANAPVRFQVQATSALGTGAFSALSNVVTPLTAPGAPTLVTATAGNTTATVTWTAPADGGSAITGYDVQEVDAAGLPVGALLPAAADATSLVVPGLVNGTAVRFQVRATNAIGTGLFSAPSAAVTPVTVPDAPVIGSVTAADASATLTWTAPADGGSPLTGYSVRVADAVTDVQVGALQSALAGATGLVVTGLVNGTAVKFQVQATNAAGTSPFSALSAAVTPIGVPSAPVIGIATAGDNSATVTWTAPANGGSPLTGYSVRVADAVTDVQVGALQSALAGATGLVVTGLVNGTAVRFQVQATNAAGTGAFSALSNAVTPLPTRMSDFNRDGRTDLVARDNAGQLWLYAGNGTGGFLPRTLMATGWGVFTAIVTPGDVTGDGNGDLMARTSGGELRLYPGNGTGGLTAFRRIGATGWNDLVEISAAGDMTGDGRPDLIARDRDGRLYLYPTTATGTFQTRRLLGASGWNAMTAIRGAGDLSGDGKADMLARDGAGVLWLYRGNGAGGIGVRTVAGASGWQVMTALVTPGNWDGTPGNDLIARDGAGLLWLYPGNNTGTFGARVQIGVGFQGYTIA